MMKKAQLLALGLIIPFVLVCAAILFFYLTPAQIGFSLQELFSKLDNLLSLAYPTEAEDLLALAAHQCKTLEDYESLLKRAFRLARLTKKNWLAKDYSLKAFKSFPKARSLYELAFYACLRAGEPEQALALPHEFALLPEIQALLAEAYLSLKTKPDPNIARDLNLYGPYLLLDRMAKADELLAAARLFDDDRLFLDAALLKLAEGDMPAAQEIASARLGAEDFDEVVGLMAYDRGDYAEALERLSRLQAKNPTRADLAILCGDLYYLNYQSEAAVRTYEKALALDKGYSVIPYLNVSFIRQEVGLDDKALFLLKEAVAVFPRKREAALELAKLYYRLKQPAKASQVLSAFKDQTKDADSEAMLLELLSNRENLSAQRFLTRLKDLFFENPKEEKVAEVLASYLLQKGELEQLKALLNYYQELNLKQSPIWFLESQALLLAWGGETEKALEIFDKALASEANWSLYFNRGVIKLSLGRLSSAAEDMLKAERLLELEPKVDKQALAAIYINRATISFKCGYKDEAKELLARALKMDPTNQDAYKLLKKLAETP